MRIALISDVHANEEALSVVADEIRKEKVDHIFHLGDVVGYGADPLSCCHWVKENCSLSLMGNHDAVVVGRMDTFYFSPHARSAIEWTAQQLDLECKEWLASLPYTYSMGEFLFSHGSPIRPEQFDYILDYDTAGEVFKFMAGSPHRILFVGHSHKAFLLEFDGVKISMKEVNGNEISEFQFEDDKYYIVSLGSVGQPRDYDPRAYFAILDTSNYSFIARRVTYDISTASKKIKEKGLPQVLADRLFVGR